MPSKRELKKIATRARIISAATQLIYESGSTNFSMIQLADTADVALVTLYKHFDSKAGVIKSLVASHSAAMNDKWEEITQSENSEPLDKVFSFCDAACIHLLEDEKLFRPAIISLLALDSLSHERLKEWAPLWAELLLSAAKSNDLLRFIDLNLVAGVIHVFFTGAVVKWASGEIGNEEFSAESIYGLALILNGIASDKGRAYLAHKLASAEAECLLLTGELDKSRHEVKVFGRTN